MRSALPWITAGQLDAGFASLASFAAGLFAVRRLSPVGLGTYALLFAAFQIVNQFPSQLVFGPAEVLSVRVNPDRRLGTLAWSLPVGIATASLTAGGVWLGALPVVAEVSASVAVPLVITAMALAAISTVQDHVRRLFHLSYASWRAASMSLLMVATVVVTLPLIGSFSAAWAPFGSLVVGNLLSLSFGLRWAAVRGVEALRRPTARELGRIGRWLLLVGLASTGFGYGAAAVIQAIAGADTLGFIEGARVVAQPLNVVALGLVAVVAPRSMEAALSGRVELARSWRLRYTALFGLVAIPYAVFSIADWSPNPLPRLLPNAYAVAGLVPAMIAATLVHGIASPLRAELLGAGLEGSLGRSVVASGVAEMAAVVAAVPHIGAFAAPVGMASGALVRWAAFVVRLRKWYSGSPSGSVSPAS